MQEDFPSNSNNGHMDKGNVKTAIMQIMNFASYFKIPN